jgi:N-acetylglucosamine-6-sulfatase
MIMTDDMEVGLVEHMPAVKELIVERGATFSRAYFNDPLCCPSRSTILTGKYAQNTGVTRNSHKQFYEAGNPDRTIAVRLKTAGYRTALVGKYLNGYPRPAPETDVPPGWDHWAARIATEGGLFYDYRLNENGRLVGYGKASSDYSTDVYGGQAIAFLKQAVADDVPFFLELSVHAPHVPSTPASRHVSWFPTLMAPRTPSFDEADVSDKPAYIRDKARASLDRLAKLDETYRQRVRSLQAVDEAVRAIVHVLEPAGRLEQTYLVFTSDNGLLHGQHRVDRAKGMPYEEVIRMPLHVRGPGVRSGLVLEHLVGNADLAPTLAEWAGAAMPDDLDGRSLAPLLREGTLESTAGRQAYPLVYEKASPRVLQPNWRGVRTRDYLYVEYDTGELELYDMRSDPYQLQNKAGSADPALLARLAKLTAELSTCKGAECRRLEDAPFEAGSIPLAHFSPP